MIDLRSKLLTKADPMTCSTLTLFREAIMSGDVILPKISYNEFLSAFDYWIANGVNNLSNLHLYTKEVCVGTTHFIDNLIMQYGLDNIQILEHDYFYYSRLNPKKQWAEVGRLDPNQPLLIAMPFPGYGDVHPLMQDILRECLDKNIAIHIDACWMSSAHNITFDFSHPCIHSVGFSLSKGLDLGWNRIGVRYTKQINSTDSITIANQFCTINQVDISIGYLYMQEFSQNYLWQRYGNTYNKICQQLLLRPTKCIHMARTFDTGKVIGLKNAIHYYDSLE